MTWIMGVTFLLDVSKAAQQLVETAALWDVVKPSPLGDLQELILAQIPEPAAIKAKGKVVWGCLPSLSVTCNAGSSKGSSVRAASLVKMQAQCQDWSFCVTGI